MNLADSHQSAFFVILPVLCHASFSKHEWLSGESAKSLINEEKDATLFLATYGLRHCWNHLEAFGRSQPRFRDKLSESSEWQAFVNSQQGTFALIRGVLNGLDFLVELLLQTGGKRLYNAAEEQRPTALYESSRLRYNFDTRPTNTKQIPANPQLTMNMDLRILMMIQ